MENVIAETKKRIRAIELVLLVRVDESLRFVGTRVRTRLRKLRTSAPAARKGRSKRSRPSLVQAAA